MSRAIAEPPNIPGYALSNEISSLLLMFPRFAGVLDSA
jgi:hypothetical protein